ncbi:MAG: hypothetical protein AB1467_02590 [Candidatus Diapherotrites archaeon]
MRKLAFGGGHREGKRGGVKRRRPRRSSNGFYIPELPHQSVQIGKYKYGITHIGRRLTVMRYYKGGKETVHDKELIKKVLIALKILKKRK